MKIESSSPKYSELYQQKYLDAFPPEAQQELNAEQLALLRELDGILTELSFETAIYKFYLDPEIPTSIREELVNYPELQNAIKQWEKPIEFTEIVTKLQEKNLGCSYYEIDPKRCKEKKCCF